MSESIKEKLQKCLFSKGEFYSNNTYPNIELICEFFEKGLIKVNDLKENGFDEIIYILDEIRFDLNGDIKKKKLEEFLNNNKEIVIKRLGLIKIIFSDYNPEEVYNEQKKRIKEINKNIDELTEIKNSISIYHKDVYLREIKLITDFIQDLNEISWNSFEKKRKRIDLLKQKLRHICDTIDSVKDFIIFKVIYDDSLGINQSERFDKAMSKLNDIKQDLACKNPNLDKIYQKYQKIFDKVKDILKDNEQKANQFIHQFLDYFNIKGNYELVSDLTLLFKSKKYEIDLKSINFFFESFNPDDLYWNKIFPKEYETLSKMSLTDMKKILTQLKQNNLYDYEDKQESLRFFRCLYDKREAIDFLKSKIGKDISYLYERIDPNDRTKTLEKLKNVEDCLNIVSTLRRFQGNTEIFNFIKMLRFNDIEKFEHFSQNYSSIIDLDKN